MNRAVFLDRDGTLIEERHYLHRVEDVALLPGVASALQRLQAAGFMLIPVTNQSGVGRGYFTLAQAEAVNRHLEQILASQGVRIARTYMAPEAPDQPSHGRKPSPQFLFDARDAFTLNLAACCMVGDKLVDLECGWNAGVGQSLLVRTGYGAQEAKKLPGHKGAVVVDDLAGAADWILHWPGPAPGKCSQP